MTDDPYSSSNATEINPSPSTISSLDLLAESARQELREISTQTQLLRQKITSQYTDLRSHPYSLHSIFVHRGTSSFGHYWIYIYDFDREIWRKYNDSSVTEVQDHNEIFNDLEKAQPGGASPPTSVYLVYVKEDERKELVGSVLRNPIAEPSESDIEMTGTNDDIVALTSETTLRGGDDNHLTVNNESSAQAALPASSRFSFDSSDDNLSTTAPASGAVIPQSEGTATWDDSEAAAAPAPQDFGPRGDEGGMRW